MEEKMLKEYKANQPKQDSLIEDIESTPIADKNIKEEKLVKEVVEEEKPVKEKETKSKGIFSGIKSLFTKK